MKGNNKFRLDIRGIIILCMIAVYALFLIYPMAHLIQQSAIDGDTGQLTMVNSSEFSPKSYYFNTLINSFKVFLASTCLSIVIGVPLAYVFSLCKIKGKSLLNTPIIVAFMSAPFIGTYSWILLPGRSGVITTFPKNIGITTPDTYGLGGTILAITLQLFPPAFLYVKGVLKDINNSLLEASSNLERPGLKYFFKVVVPLIMPTLLAAALLVFMRSSADFGIPMLIGEGYRTSLVALYAEFINKVSGNDGFTAAIAMTAIVVTTVVLSAQKYVSNRNSFLLNALYPMEEKEAKGPVKILVYLVAYTIVGIAILSQAYVTYTSFKNMEGEVFVSGHSLPSYASAFGKLGQSIQNTLIIPTRALVIIVLLAVLITYLVIGRENALTNTMDIISIIPYIVPSIVLGIALLTGLSKRPILLSGTMLIMVMALVIRRLPYTIRSSVAILQQIPMSIEETAISLGVSKMRSFFKATVSMTTSEIVAGAILSWVTMISKLSTTIILYIGRIKTLTVAMYMEVVRNNYGIAAALSTILTALTVVSLLIFSKINGGKNLSL